MCQACTVAVSVILMNFKRAAAGSGTYLPQSIGVDVPLRGEIGAENLVDSHFRLAWYLRVK